MEDTVYGNGGNSADGETVHLIIRADGGPDIGYGHLIRSGALAEKLCTQGHTVTIATTTPTPAQSVVSQTANTVTLPSRSDPEPFIEWLDTVNPNVVFTDAYPVDTTYQRAIRGRVPLAVLQDDARHPVCANLFVNGNLYAADLDYEFVGQSPDTYLGTDYALLRKEIRSRVSEELPWREQPERAIIMMGGSDIGRVTPTVVRAFDGHDIHADAIVGPGCSDDQERNVRTAASTVSANSSSGQ